MMLAIPIVILFYTIAAILAGRGLLQPKNHNIPRSIKLQQIVSTAENTTGLTSHAAAALLKHQYGRRSVAPQISEGGWWFAQFHVGRSRDLNLMVDTGSADIAVNPNLYQPSKRAQAVNVTSSLHYNTTQPDGCGMSDIRFDEYRDHVAMDGLFVARQHFASVVDQPDDPGNGTLTRYPGGGIIGWSTRASSQLNTTSWFEKVCMNHAIPECRFGIAMGTDGNGEMYLGGVDNNEFYGQLSRTSIERPWVVNGSVGVDNKTTESNLTILLDTGTVNIIGPVSAVQKIFDTAGIQGKITSDESCSKILLGTYDCSSPPSIGFSFTDSNNDNNKTGFFNIEAEAFAAANDGSGNCTSTLIGIDYPPSDSSDELWIVGQSWFQGKYVDHNLGDQSMGFATLRSKSLDVS